MCTKTIIDACVFSKVFDNKTGNGHSELRSWIKNRHGIIVYSQTGGYYEELCKQKEILNLFMRYRQGQQAQLVGNDELSSAEDTLRNAEIQSNDKHILALASASKTLVLCTDDRKLKDDFLDTNLLQKIGRKSRAVYPIDGVKKQRRDFLGKRKCSTER